jgi:hypothetical protein
MSRHSRIGGIGECLCATRSKNWGAGPHVLPLDLGDWFYPDRLTYAFKTNSLYNRRFNQRRRMKKLLGPHRRLVTDAVGATKAFFLGRLTGEQRDAIWATFRVGPGSFWRAAKGQHFLDLPVEFRQGELAFAD